MIFSDFAPSLKRLYIMLCLLPLGTLAAATSMHDFLWEQANAQAMVASTPADHLRAANTYNRLVLEGVCNGLLFLNLGNTLVMGGDGANANAAFVRAERYIGFTPEIRQGLAAAGALKNGRRSDDLPWSRTAFFWHYALSCHVRALTALAGWSILWFGALLRILLRRKAHHTLLRSLAETCLLTGGLLAVIFGTSMLMTLAHEHHDKETWPARVFVSTTHTDVEDLP